MNCFSGVLCHSITIFIPQFKNVNASMIICISFYCLDWSIATLPWSLRGQCQADGCSAWRLVHKLATKRLTCLIILDDCSSGMTSLSISSTDTTVIIVNNDRRASEYLTSYYGRRLTTAESGRLTALKRLTSIAASHLWPAPSCGPAPY